VGNYNTRAIRFRQSITDFPLTVSLGEKLPSWGMKRWRGNGGLRFLPSDDEGFTLRGDKRRLEYRGRRRSHRFTILDDGAFEYDVILLREPERNVISLRMEGAERFDFFRQPDFVSDPFLRGSFAVYKKETLIGEGTGKLCHIHRPEVIDARGRRCWGELAVVGNELRITIPANWLGEAKYPVVVDPTIGTTIIGSQIRWNMDTNSSSNFAIQIAKRVAVNRFLVSETITGACRAYAYASSGYTDTGGRGIIYYEYLIKPYSKMSNGEQLIDLQVLAASKPSSWRSALFNVGTINSGSYIWFGITSENAWTPVFDFGATCYAEKWESTSTPSAYPNITTATAYDIKLSMYFTYMANFIRTLTQGVNLTDIRKAKVGYIRRVLQTVGVTSLFGKFKTISRKCIDTVSNTVNISRFPVLCREIKEILSLTVVKWENRLISKIFNDSVGAESDIKSKLSIFRKVEDVISGIDSQEFTFLFYRSVTDTTAIFQVNYGIRLFYREVKDMIENTDSLAKEASFYRYQADTVHVESSLFRKAAFFVRIVAQLFVHDLIFGRFLKAKSEIILKSCVTREITIESKIN